jgi:hypothetical protein
VDSPAINLRMLGGNDNGTAEWSFTMWYMVRPNDPFISPSDSVWVPVAKLTWTLKFGVELWFGQWRIRPGSVVLSPERNFVSTTVFPQWSRVGPISP